MLRSMSNCIVVFPFGLRSGVGDSVSDGTGISSAAPLIERACPPGGLARFLGVGLAMDSGSATTGASGTGVAPGDDVILSSPVQLLPGFDMSVMVMVLTPEAVMGYSLRSLLSARTLPLSRRRWSSAAGARG